MDKDKVRKKPTGAGDALRYRAEARTPEAKVVAGLIEVWRSNMGRADTILGADVSVDPATVLAPLAAPVPREQVADYCRSARNMLRQPASRDEIAQAIDVIGRRKKSTLIPDVVEHLVEMAEAIAAAKFSGPVLAAAVAEVPARFIWTPEIPVFLGECAAIQDQAEGGILLIEEPAAPIVRYNVMFLGYGEARALSQLREARSERLGREAQMATARTEEQARPAIDPERAAQRRASYEARVSEMEERHARWIETPEGRRQEERERALDEERRARSRPVYRY
jgi:hypothetical protein